MKMSMKVESTAINRIEYDEDTELLSITFNSGGTYDYPRVPNELVKQFVEADSKGKFYHQHLKNYSINRL